MFAYNFGGRTVRGRLQVTAPDGWTIQLPNALELAPLERRELTLVADGAAAPTNLPVQVRVHGDFGRVDKPVLSFRLLEEPRK